MTSHSDGGATNGNRAVVAVTVAITGDSVGDGAVAAADDTVIDDTVADTGTMKKQNFHTGLDPVSRTKNSAQPTEFDAAATANGNVPSATPTDMLSLDSRFRGNDGAVVVGGGGGVGDGAVVVGTVADGDDGVGDGAVVTVTVTNPDDETIATNSNHLKSSFPRKRESRTNNPAQPTEFNAGVGDTVTVAGDEISVVSVNQFKSSFPQEAGIQTQGQQAAGEALSWTANTGDDTLASPAAGDVADAAVGATTAAAAAGATTAATTDTDTNATATATTAASATDTATSDAATYDFIRHLPKAELHCHIEGALTPELMLAFARRNGVTLMHDSVDALRAAYRFNNLQGFLDIYYAGMTALQTERDFYELTADYVRCARADGVRHAEIFFDPQAHTARGVPLAAVVGGITSALRDAMREHDFTSKLILCFLRHLDEADALTTLTAVRAHRDDIAGVGLDSGEAGNPPQKFARVFAAARVQGYRRVAHAGEEGPATYIRDALDVLGVERIDHGNAAAGDERLLDRLADEQVPLTMCPLSNLQLGVVKDLADHPLKKMLRRGLKVTVNSDDPAYFGGYINDNYRAAADALDLDRGDLIQLAHNSVTASFAGDHRRQTLLAEIDRYAAR